MVSATYSSGIKSLKVLKLFSDSYRIQVRNTGVHWQLREKDIIGKNLNGIVLTQMQCKYKAKWWMGFS